MVVVRENESHDLEPTDEAGGTQPASDTPTSTPAPKPDAPVVDADAIPAAMRSRETWLCWRYVWNAEREKWDKVPIQATRGGRAKSTDPETWSDFDTALAAYRDRADCDGIGYVFTEDGPHVGIDLDDVYDPETDTWSAAATAIIERVDSFTEFSPSETGGHIVAAGLKPEDRCRSALPAEEGFPDQEIEMYDQARYFTVTGHHVEGTPTTVEPRGQAVHDIHAEYLARTCDADQTTVGDCHDEDGAQAAPGAVAALSDADLLDKARSAKNGDRFAQLYDRGAWESLGYPSHSEARQALVNWLAFWCGKDEARMRRLFAQSVLAVEKPEKSMRDFDNYAAANALAEVDEVYDPTYGQQNADGVPTAHTPDSSGEEGGADTTTTATGDCLTPAGIEALAGLADDETVASLTDREKAFYVWQAITRSNAHHLMADVDGTLYAYHDGVWRPDGEQRARELAAQALGDAYGANVLTELVERIRAERTISRSERGVPVGTVAVANGLLDLDAAADGAGEDALRDLRPDDYAMARLGADERNGIDGVRYDPDADADEWAALVEEWAENGMADALQEFVGYCLHVGANPIHRALLLVGSGANGKGTFLHVVRALLGRDHTTAIELQTLANDADAVADFHGAFANIDDDLSARKLGAGVGMFKKLVAGDPVRARHLYKDGFEFDSTGKHLYAANEVPQVEVPDDDEAFWRRWLLVEFPNHYPPGQRDLNLKPRLASPDALSGVLNWAVEGRRRLLDQGYFTNEPRHAFERCERWRAWGESADKFISTCVERDPDAPRRSTADVFARYEAWCREHGEEPVSQQALTNKLKGANVGYKQSVRVDGQSTPVRGYTALGFTDEVPAPVDPEADASDVHAGGMQTRL